MRVSLTEFCSTHDLEQLLDQWDREKNGMLSPDELSYGSKQRVWWRCEQGHSWQTMVYARTSGGAGCPYCAGKKVMPGENDLASQRPDLAGQWHPTKNLDLTPDQVTEGSHRAVWWMCARGHEWRASVRSRSGGNGCPVCAGKVIVPGENDLATVFPDIAGQWHPTKNGSLTPQNITVGSTRKVWWRCEKGHQWQAGVAVRARGCGCPVCAGKVIVPGENDLASAFPDLAAQWHPTKNGTLAPDRLATSSNRKVWWRCELGHDYQAVIADRTGRGSGCPYCANRRVLAGFNDLATVEPKIAEQWHPTLNRALTPQQVTCGCHRRAWWQCPEGHVWKAAIYSRTGAEKCGCPICAGRYKAARTARYAEICSTVPYADHTAIK